MNHTSYQLRYLVRVAADRPTAKVRSKAGVPWRKRRPRVAASLLVAIAGFALVSCALPGAAQPDSSCDQPTRSTSSSSSQAYGQQTRTGKVSDGSDRVEVVYTSPTPQTSPTMCAGANGDNKPHYSVTYDNANFVSNIRKAFQINPKRFSALDVVYNGSTRIQAGFIRSANSYCWNYVSLSRNIC